MNAPPSAGEVRALAQRLMSWADQLAARPRINHAVASADRQEVVLTLATAARAVTRLRAKIFPDVGFADPAWALMLEIFIRETNGYRVSLDQMTAEEDLPPLVLYRSCNLLIDQGLIERSEGKGPQERVWVSLTLAGKRKMTELLIESAEYIRRRCADVDSESEAPQPL